MNHLVLLDKYILDPKCQSKTGFIFEVSHFYKTGESGKWQTPIGIIVGYLEFRPHYWTVKVILRSDVYYASEENKIVVVVESAYADKLQYAIDYQKLKEKTHLPIDSNFKSEFVKYLIKENICTEPLFLEVGIGSIKEHLQLGSLSLDDFD